MTTTIWGQTEKKQKGKPRRRWIIKSKIKMGKGISSHYNVVAKPRASTSRVSFHGNQYPLTGEYWRPGEGYGEGWRPMFLLLIRILVERGWRIFPYIWINILLWVVDRKGRKCSYMPVYNIYYIWESIYLAERWGAYVGVYGNQYLVVVGGWGQEGASPISIIPAPLADVVCTQNSPICKVA